VPPPNYVVPNVPFAEPDTQYPQPQQSMVWRPRFLINPNSRSTQLTVVKSQSTWALTSKHPPTNSIEPFWLVDTLVGPTQGQRLGQTPFKP
jgi:hypothetical protein